MLTYEIERITMGTNQFLNIIASTVNSRSLYNVCFKVIGINKWVYFFIKPLYLLILLRNRTQSASTSGEKLSMAGKDLYSSTIKQLEGMKTVKSFNMEDKNNELFQNISNNVAQKYRMP